MRSSPICRCRIRSSRSKRTTSRSCTAASGSSAISRGSATTTIRSPRSGTSRTGSGVRTSRPPDTDWWTAHYPPDNMKRPTGPLCDGCHSVNYDIATKQVTEWNVGCEKCHGPARRHVAAPSRTNIVNPARLDRVRANDTCIQCHSQGQPLDESDSRPVLRLARRLPSGPRPEGLLEARRAHARRDDVHAFRGRDGAQEPHAGKRFRHERDVYARRHLFQLSRRARHGATTRI